MAITYGPKLAKIINALTDESYDVDFRALLRAVDQLTFLSVLDRTLTAPPVSPVNGDAHIVATGGTGAWAGRDGFVAVWTTDNPVTPAGLWEFYAPKDGWFAWSVADADFYVSIAAVWTLFSSGGGGSSTLAADTDVVLTSPAQADLLTFDLTSGKWINAPLTFLVGGKFATDVGDGSTLIIGVNHNLGTADVLVGIYDISTGQEEPVTTTYEIVDDNNVSVTFQSAPLTNSKRVVVLSSGQDSTLALLGDTDITSPANLDILQYNTSSSKWKNAVLSALSNPLTTLGDLILAGVSGVLNRLGIGSTGQVLTVVGGTAAWATPAGGSSTLAADTDVTITSPTIGDVLTWNGTKWVNQAAGGGGGTTLQVNGTTLSGTATLNLAPGANTNILVTDVGAGKVTFEVAKGAFSNTLVKGSSGSGILVASGITDDGSTIAIASNFINMQVFIGFKMTGIPVFANNAAAITGGIPTNGLYRTGADPDFIAVVH